MKSLFASIAAVALTSGLATAASAEPFNGAFVGGQVGWNQDDIGSPTSPVGPVIVDESQDSVSGGLFLGYDHKVSPNFVLGAEAGVQFGADDEVVANRGSSLVTIDPKRSFDLTARAGYLAGENTLVYARGGYANARVNTAIQDVNGFRSASENRDGWLVGGGVEQALSDNVSARVEYRYSDLGDSNGKYDRHQALFGIAYRF
jgi:outer membrane immunogenic protein